MEQAIKKLLTKNRTEGTYHTHVSLIAPKGKFMFNSQTREEFWNLYCTLMDDSYNKLDKPKNRSRSQNVESGSEVESDVEQDVEQDEQESKQDNSSEPVLGIAERGTNENIPVLVDIDLRLKDESSDSKDTIIPDALYTENQLKAVVGIYQSVLRQIINDCSDQDLNCVVLEKQMYQQTKNEITYFKHGFHLHFPIFISRTDQEIHLIPRVQQELTKLNLFQNLGIQDSATVVDKASCSVPWLLYGSRKSEDHKPYLFTKVYNSDLQEISLEQAFRSYSIMDYREQLIPLSKKVRFYLPRILSIAIDGRPIKTLKKGLISPLKEQLKKERKTSTVQKQVSVEEGLALAKQLLPMIADFRASDFLEWMTIGWTLHNISEGSIEGLELWMDFSSRCEEKYDEGACSLKWKTMVKNDTPGIGTLRHFANIDSPELYKKFKNERSASHIDNSIDGSHNDIAKALFEEYGDEFKCTSISNRTWYQFIDHHWERIEEGIYLREKISGKKISGSFVDRIKKLYDKMQDCNDKADSALIQAKIKVLQTNIRNTKNTNFKSAVLKECMEVFYDPKFNDKLDANPYLIGFKNGVYDLKLNVFRSGRPEDYLSKHMPINYIACTEDDEKVHEVHTFLEQIFPDKSLRKYFLDVSSDIFVGGNHEKIVVFWTGEGDNGKSVLQKFFDLMLGKMCIKLNTNVITGKKPNAGTAFADLARTGGGVRLAVLEEPDSDEMINSGIFKHLSGGDNFYARDLFEKGKESKEITPLFKLIFICNKLPRFKASDKAVWNRARVIPFETVFCRPDNPAPETYEEQLRQKRFPMDKYFSKKIPDLVETFCWVLLQHRIKIMNCGRVDPPKVLEATENYRKQNDIYRQFIDEMIYDKDKDRCITLVELYNLYKEWYKESMSGSSVPNKNDVEEYFTKMWGAPMVGKKWKGYRQRTIQDSLDANTVINIPENEIVNYGLPPI